MPAYPSRKNRKIAPGPEVMTGPRPALGHWRRILVVPVLMAPVVLATMPMTGLPAGLIGDAIITQAAERPSEPVREAAQRAAGEPVATLQNRAGGGQGDGAITGDAYLDKGCGLPVDLPAVRAHYEAGAAAGDVDATLRLAQMLTFGRGKDPQDTVRGRQLLTDLMSGTPPHIQATAMALLAESRLERRGDEKQAARLIDQALTIEPDNAFAQAALATLLLRTHDEAGAEAALRAAISAAPNWAPFYIRLAVLKESLRLTDEAQALRLAAARIGQRSCIVAH